MRSSRVKRCCSSAMCEAQVLLQCAQHCVHPCLLSVTSDKTAKSIAADQAPPNCTGKINVGHEIGIGRGSKAPNQPRPAQTNGLLLSFRQALCSANFKSSLHYTLQVSSWSDNSCSSCSKLCTACAVQAHDDSRTRWYHTQAVYMAGRIMP